MENEVLTTLDLSLNHITDQGIETILNYLESNRTLTKLDLSDNEIGNKGAKLILSFIEKHMTVYVEIAHNNNISEYFSKAIIFKNSYNKKLTDSSETAQAKTVIKEDKEKYKLKTQTKFLKTIKEEREEEELTCQIGTNKEEREEVAVTFHVGTNKNIFLAENEFHLGLSGLYETELPDLI